MDVMLSESETGRFVRAGSLRVHYNEAGSGTPLIFCEGQGAGTSAWVVYHRVVPMLATRFRCLLLGRSWTRRETVGPANSRATLPNSSNESRHSLYFGQTRGNSLPSIESPA